jgi:DNA (cytosine-5)-methyltransferase 1
MRSEDASRLTIVAHCRLCRDDQEWLRQTETPSRAAPTEGEVLRMADLFAGCGGLSFGLAEAARRHGVAAEVVLAVEREHHALAVFERNLPTRFAHEDEVESLFDGELGEPLTFQERKLAKVVGSVDLLVGGPPCQGNSDLNNKTRRHDPRNRLYARMARAAEVLRPACVLIENVPSVRHDRTRVVTVTRDALEAAGYQCVEQVIDASAAGVPQRRVRHVLVAVLNQKIDLTFLGQVDRCSHTRSIGWAIRDLETYSSDAVFDSAAGVSAENRRRMAWLFEHRQYDLPNAERPKCHQSEHSYGSMYGRLRWRDPAQTLTTGFGSMGQGRYVHPSRRRTLTPHEAARIQTFPDYFDFVDTPRTPLASMLGNAVPPLLNIALGERLIPQLISQRMLRNNAALVGRA